MHRLTESDIAIINKAIYDITGDSDQGIYTQPTGIPTTEKEPVIYMRWRTGGMHGGSYHSDSCLRKFEGDGKPNFYALDKALSVIYPNITYLQHKEIEHLIKETEDNDYPDYYGNYSEYDVEYIVLEDLYKYIFTA